MNSIWFQAWKSVETDSRPEYVQASNANLEDYVFHKLQLGEVY